MRSHAELLRIVQRGVPHITCTTWLPVAALLPGADRRIRGRLNSRLLWGQDLPGLLPVERVVLLLQIVDLVLEKLLNITLMSCRHRVLGV